MNKTKKLLGLLLCLSMAFTLLAGLGITASAAGEYTVTITVTPSEASGANVAVLPVNADDTYGNSLRATSGAYSLNDGMEYELRVSYYGYETQKHRLNQENNYLLPNGDTTGTIQIILESGDTEIRVYRQPEGGDRVLAANLTRSVLESNINIAGSGDLWAYLWGGIGTETLIPNENFAWNGARVDRIVPIDTVFMLAGLKDYWTASASAKVETLAADGFAAPSATYDMLMTTHIYYYDDNDVQHVVPSGIAVSWESKNGIDRSAPDLGLSPYDSGNLRLFFGISADQYQTVLDNLENEIQLDNDTIPRGNRLPSWVTEITLVHDASYVPPAPPPVVIPPDSGNTPPAPGNTPGNTTGNTDNNNTTSDAGSNVVEPQTKIDDSGKVTTSVTTDALKNALENALKAFEDAKAAGDAEAVGEIKIEVVAPKDSNTPATAMEVSIPASAIKSIADAKDVVLTIESETATITLDSATLAGIAAEAATGATVKITATIVDAKSELTAEQIEIVGDNPVIDISVFIGNSQISNFEGSVTVSIPYKPPANVASADQDLLTVYCLDESGNIQEIAGAMYDARTGTITFTTSHFSVFFVAEWINPFGDVTKSDPYYRAVRFAYSSGLMNGMTEDSFAPNATMTRAMLVTILWRFDGEPQAGSSAFSDVSAGQWYTGAVAWANANGIVLGYGDGRFGTEDSITQEQMIAVLYRYAEHKGYDTSATTTSAFTGADSVSAWAMDAIIWAIAANLTRGSNNMSGDAIRSEIAVLMQNFVENIKI